MNVIVRLGFELAYYDVADLHVSHNAKGTPTPLFSMITVQQTLKNVRSLEWLVFPLLSYTPNLAPTDLFLVSSLEHLNGRTFRNKEKIVNFFFSEKTPDFLNVESKICNPVGLESLKMKVMIVLMILYTNPSARAGYDTRSIFKRSLTGLNSEFSFSLTSCLTKAEEHSLSYYLPIAGGRIIGFIPFPRVLVLCEMQSVSSKIWTRVAVSISYDDNDYTTGTS